MTEPRGRSAGRSSAHASLGAFLEWLAAAPEGTALDASALHATLLPFVASPSPTPSPSPVEASAATWRERLWTVPPDTRLGVRDVAEAFGRPASWVYRHTSPKAGLPQLPVRKLDGELQFVAGELRAWLRENEEVVTIGRASAHLTLSVG